MHTYSDCVYDCEHAVHAVCPCSSAHESMKTCKLYHICKLEFLYPQEPLHTLNTVLLLLSAYMLACTTHCTTHYTFIQYIYNICRTASHAVGDHTRQPHTVGRAPNSAYQPHCNSASSSARHCCCPRCLHRSVHSLYFRVGCTGHVTVRASSAGYNCRVHLGEVSY
jgi:hypothetical protein